MRRGYGSTRVANGSADATTSRTCRHRPCLLEAVLLLSIPIVRHVGADRTLADHFFNLFCVAAGDALATRLGGHSVRTADCRTLPCTTPAHLVLPRVWVR